MSLLAKIKHRFRPEGLRVVSVTAARNEADVIEAFVRHTAAHVDHLIVADHCSHDGTLRILGELAAEGLPLTVLRCASPIYNQAPLTTLLVRRAIHDHEADWVVPLDADEFLWPLGGETDDIRRVLCRHDRVLRYRFRTFHPDPAHDPAPDAERNPALRITRRFTEESGVAHKIIVPRSAARRGGARIGPGNHDFWVGENRLPAIDVDRDLALGHFPVRSPLQFALKVAVAEMGKNSMGRKRKGLGIHKSEQFARLLADPAAFLATALATDRPTVSDPLPYLGGPLRFTPPAGTPADAVSLLLRYADALAREHGRLADKSRGDRNPLVDTRGIELEPLAPAGPAVEADLAPDPPTRAS